MCLWLEGCMALMKEKVGKLEQQQSKSRKTSKGSKQGAEPWELA